MKMISGAVLIALAAGPVLAEPVTYNVDPNHTFPSFEADHMGGMSMWRGKIKSSSGTVVLDKQAHSGKVDVTMDMKTLDFGHDGMNKHALSKDMFGVDEFPTAKYTGTLTFTGDTPTGVDGMLTLHGVTKPVKLTIGSFVCRPNPRTKMDGCGADASATINRDDFGVDFGKQMGFKMPVKLAIQIEAGVAPK